MSQTIGPATKAAIARIVAHLPYLKAEGTGVPTASRDGIASIKAKYSAIHADPNGDPMFTAAGQWAEEEIQKGLDADAKGEKKDEKPEPKQDGLAPLFGAKEKLYDPKPTEPAPAAPVTQEVAK